MGAVIWITGLSGVGKSSTAEALIRRLRAGHENAILIDGDAVRDIVRDPAAGHDRDGRLANAYRISRLCAFLAGQNQTVVAATMSLFHCIHDWNRRHLPGYFEVLLEAPLEVLRQRDPKGLYRRFDADRERHVGGLDLDVEFPVRPDLVLDNAADSADREPLAAAILAAFRQARPPRRDAARGSERP